MNVEPDLVTIRLHVHGMDCADETALVARFVQHGYAAPAFKMVGDIRTALVADPDGELVQLVIAPAGSPEPGSAA